MRRLFFDSFFDSSFDLAFFFPQGSRRIPQAGTRSQGALRAACGRARLYALIADPAFAAASPTGTTDFDALYNRLLGWVGGSLGKSVALAFLVVGLCVGIIRGNLTAAIVTLGAGIALAMFPAIIENLFTLGS